MTTFARSLPPLVWGNLRTSPARQTSIAAFARVFSSTAQPVAAPSRLTPRSLPQNALVLLRGHRSAVTRRSLRFKSDKRPNPDPTPHLGSPDPAPSFSQKLKILARQYGWLALGVYMGLSALDFPCCFVLVRMLGTDRIGHYEHLIVEGVKTILQKPFPNLWKKSEPVTPDEQVEPSAREGSAATHVARGDKAEASIWTQLALAYAVHKSLIFIRIPLTAAILPKVAKTLRAWGYNVGRAKPAK